MLNVSDLLDQAVIKQTAEKNSLLVALRSFPNAFFLCDDPEALSILNSLVQNPNISTDSFKWFISEVQNGR